MKREFLRRAFTVVALATASACSREIAAPRGAESVQLNHSHAKSMALNAVAVDGEVWYGSGGELYPTEGLSAKIDTKETTISTGTFNYDYPVTFTATHTGMWNSGSTEAIVTWSVGSPPSTVTLSGGDGCVMWQYAGTGESYCVGRKAVNSYQVGAQCGTTAGASTVHNAWIIGTWSVTYQNVNIPGYRLGEQSIGSTAPSANLPSCAPPPPPPPPPTNACAAYTTEFISVSEWTTESSDCDTGSGGGTTVGNGITCYGTWLILEINRWDGTGWHVIWEGWGTVCY